MIIITNRRRKKIDCSNRSRDRKKNCQNLRTFEEEGLKFSPIAVDIGREKGGAG